MTTLPPFGAVICALVVLLPAAAFAQDDYEGDGPGECTDKADNDRDGKFDCDDDGCAGSPDCESGDASESPAAETAITETAITLPTEFPITKALRVRRLPNGVKIDFGQFNRSEGITVDLCKLFYDRVYDGKNAAHCSFQGPIGNIMAPFFLVVEVKGAYYFLAEYLRRNAEGSMATNQGSLPLTQYWFDESDGDAIRVDIQGSVVAIRQIALGDVPVAFREEK